MTRDGILECVKDNLNYLSTYNSDEITEDTTIGVNGDIDDLDSLDVVELTMNLEECFSIKIPDEDIDFSGTHSVKDIIDYIYPKVNE